MIRFYAGETKEVRIKVVSTRNLPFTIANPSFELIRDATGVVEIAGDAQMEEHEIYALISPEISGGTYSLMFSYDVAMERLKALVEIEVK